MQSLTVVSGLEDQDEVSCILHILSAFEGGAGANRDERAEMKRLLSLLKILSLASDE